MTAVYIATGHGSWGRGGTPDLAVREAMLHVDNRREAAGDLAVYGTFARDLEDVYVDDYGRLQTSPDACFAYIYGPNPLGLVSACRCGHAFGAHDEDGLCEGYALDPQHVGEGLNAYWTSGEPCGCSGFSVQATLPL